MHKIGINFIFFISIILFIKNFLDFTISKIMALHLHNFEQASNKMLLKLVDFIFM